MSLSNIVMQEVPYNAWIEGRRSEGAGFQKKYSLPDKKIGYGILIDYPDYESFGEVLDDLTLDDSALIDGVGLFYKNYKRPYLFSFEKLKTKEKERGKFMRNSRNCKKLYLQLKQESGKKTNGERVFYRKKDSLIVPSTIRIKPNQLDHFTYYGFHDDRIFFIKADNYPIDPIKKRLN